MPVVVIAEWWANDASHTAHYKPEPHGDLGAVMRPIPQWAVHGSRIAHLIAIDGKLTGVVLIGGVPAVNYLVRCYYRHTGDLVGGAWTNAAGEFTFINLTRDDMYYVVAFDDTNSLPNYNAQIYDMLLTVNM